MKHNNYTLQLGITDLTQWGCHTLRLSIRLLPLNTLNWMQKDIYLEWYPIVVYEKYIQLRNAYVITSSTLICYYENPESKICDIVNIFKRGGN